MDNSGTTQPPCGIGALARSAAANAALATDVDAASVDRYPETLAGLTGCDLILAYESTGSDESLALVGQWGIPPDRLRTGKLQVKREPVLLREVVRSAIESIRPALFAKHQALKLDEHQSDIVLDIDRCACRRHS
jgi:hypothetical protein